MFICVSSKRKSHLNQPVCLSALLSAEWKLKIRGGEESCLIMAVKERKALLIPGMESFSYSL